jgi:hypothetical protein
VPVSVLTSSLSVNSASFALTASYALSASFASTVPASGVIGLNLSQIATASFTASVSPTQFTVTSASITEFTVTGTGVTIGNAITDIHTVTGSFNVSGSAAIVGNTQITGSLNISSSNLNTVIVGNPTGPGVELSPLNQSYKFKVGNGNWGFFITGSSGGTLISGGAYNLDLRSNLTIENNVSFITRNSTFRHQLFASTWNITDFITGAQRLSINQGGNVLIGTGSISTGVLLDVRAQGALSTDTAFRVRNTANDRNLIGISGNGDIEIRTNRVSLARSQRINIGGNNTDNAIDAAAYDEIVMLGYNNTNANQRTTILGSSNSCNIAANFPSVIVGYSNTSSAGVTGATIIGRNNTGQGSIMVGAGNAANGVLGPVCIGNSNTVSQTNGFPTLPMFLIGSNLTIPNNAATNNCVFLSAGSGSGNPFVTIKNDNLLIGTLTPWTSNFDNNSRGVFYTRTGIAPTTLAADSFGLYSADRNGVAGKASPHFRTEDGTVLWLGDESRLFNVTSSVILNGTSSAPSLNTTAIITQTNSGSFTVYSFPTASYDTAFFEYSVKSGSNARAGTIMAIQSGTSVNFTETTTTDFGNTTPVSFTVIVTGSNMALTGSSTSGAWTIKTIIRTI